MRIAVLDTVYPKFVADLYARTPSLARRPYEEQLQVLLDASFGTSDAYTQGLRDLGHEAENFVTNALPLQASWLRRERLGRLARAADSLPGRAGGGTRHLIYQAIAAAQI